MRLSWQQRGGPERLLSVSARIGSCCVARFGWSVALAFTTGIASAVVLDPPGLRCASANVSGDVTLNWSIPADPGNDCLQYEIWSAPTAAGPFSLITTVPCGQMSYTHLGAGANAGPQFYYLTTVSTSPPPNTSVPSDTVSTIFLQVFQSTPLGSANLSWNAPATAATAASEFTVWLEYPVGTWSQVATVPSTTFSYQWVVSICEDSLTFRVGLSDALGCISFSNRDGEVFHDVTPPTVPVIAAVSVDSLTGLSNIIWGPSPEPDTDGYIIVWNGPSGGVIIDTVFGQANNSYAWPDSWPFDGPESFTIAAFDTCETGTPPSPNTSATGAPHTTMHARTTYDRCAALVSLSWTAYGGWVPQSQEIFVQLDGGPWALLANLSGTALQYAHAVLPGHTYCYLVKAIQGPGLPASLSNKTCLFTTYPAIPVDNYIRTVTVTGPTSILVVDSVDYAAEAGGYRLQRSTNGSAFELVQSFPATAGPVIQWTDGDVSTALNGYRYRMQVLDSCGSAAVMSNTAGSIVLQAKGELGGVSRLAWNGYEEWAGIVAGYDIYRSIAQGPFELIATVPPDPWSYDDDVNPFIAETGDFCYYVQAVEAGNPSGVNAFSSSNIACAPQQDLVFIPNAFIVGSRFNPVFKPVIGFVDVSEYKLLIINRWGQTIWETDDPDEGWDGVVGSQVMPIGVYAYYCSVRSGAGKQVEERGTVTLIAEGE